MSTGTVLFDPQDPEVRCDPYPTYRRMREEAPAWQSPDGVWYFTRYDDCVTLFRSPAISYDTMRTSRFEASLSDDPATRAHQIDESRKNQSLLDKDPPEHTRLRSLINRAFTAPTVEASRPAIVAIVDHLLDALAEGASDDESGEVDLVSGFGSLLPILVICDMMGIPTDDRDTFLEIGHAVARSVDPDVPIEQKLEANGRLREYIAGLVEARRERPSDDLMTRLIEAADDGRLASVDELLINTGILLIAGFETTTNLLTNAIYRLLTHPDQLAALRSDPTLIRTCVEEVLRFDPPSQFMRPRAIVEEIEVRGVRLRPGDSVVPLLAAGNRDPEEFPDADTFDIGRRVNRHLSFGVGHHLCVGAALARMEAQIAIPAIFERFPDLSLGDEPPVYRPNIQLRGFARLPVRLHS